MVYLWTQLSETFESSMNFIVNKFTYFLLATSVMLAGFKAEEAIVMAQMPSDSQSWIDYATGPFGALIICLVVIYFTVKYMTKKDEIINKKEEEKDSLYILLIEEKEKRIVDKENRIKELENQ